MALLEIKCEPPLERTIASKGASPLQDGAPTCLKQAGISYGMERRVWVDNNPRCCKAVVTSKYYMYSPQAPRDCTVPV